MSLRGTQEGFTLIELLVVIAIIGTLASVVLASLGSARTKARDGAIKAQVLEVRKLLQLEYSESGSYLALSQKGWAGTSSTCDSKNFTGNYAAQVIQMCARIVELVEPDGITEFIIGVDNNSNPAPSFDQVRNVSVMARLSNGDYFCVGSSGGVYEGPVVYNGQSYNWGGPGCWSNP